MHPPRKSWFRLVSTLALPLLAAAATSVACGGGNENLPPPPPPPPIPAVETAEPAATAPTPPEAPPEPPAPPVTLTPGAAAPDPTPPPKVAIVAPTKNQVIPADKAGDFAVKLDVKDFPTAPGSNHLHLILDNKPFVAVHDPKKPTKLSELSKGEPIGEGLHVLVAFPSRANHESVKTKGALAIVPFWVGKRGDAKDDFTSKPMLIYSQPTGAYHGEMANHVLVDFYVANVTLEEGKAHVNVTVTGPGIDRALEAKVTEFGPPLYLDNLRNGSYEIKAELVDGSNKPIEGPWSSTTRTITIDHDAPTEPAAAQGVPASDGGPAKAGEKNAAEKPAAEAPKKAPAPAPTMTSPLPSMGGGATQ